MILSKKIYKKKYFYYKYFECKQVKHTQQAFKPPSAQTWSEFFVFLASFLMQKIIIFFHVYYFIIIIIFKRELFLIRTQAHDLYPIKS